MATNPRNTSGNNNDDANETNVVDERLNINEASVEQIMGMAPQMGRKRAEFIVKFRETNEGKKFKDFDDLYKIPGLGRELVETMKRFARCE